MRYYIDVERILANRHPAAFAPLEPASVTYPESLKRVIRERNSRKSKARKARRRILEEMWKHLPIGADAESGAQASEEPARRPAAAQSGKH